MKLKDGEIIKLNEITDFEWDRVYSFFPYTSKKYIEDIIGFKFDGLIESVNEGMNEIIFVKNNEVICYIYGYPSNNGYSILFKPFDNKIFYLVLEFDENLKFKVDNNNEIVYLKFRSEK